MGKGATVRQKERAEGQVSLTFVDRHFVAGLMGEKQKKVRITKGVKKGELPRVYLQAGPG